MEWIYWPKKIDFKEVWINWLWAFISGIVWSAIIFMILFFLWGIIDISWTVAWNNFWNTSGSFIMPFLISVITFFAVTFSMYSTYLFLASTSPERYKKTSIHLAQIFIFLVVLYVVITPFYLALGYKNEAYIIPVFIAHILLSIFGVNLILDSLNNFRHILISIYSSLISIMISTWIIVIAFTSLSLWLAKLIALIILLPLANTLFITIKESLMTMYYNYFKFAWVDPIWDIFHRIEIEEEDELREELNSNI